MPYQKLGRIPKGDPGSQDFAFYGLNGGLNIKSAPQMVADNELTIGNEVYLRADGGIQMRNGMAIYNNTATGGPGQLTLARQYQDIVNGTVQSPELVALLGQVGNHLYSIPTSGPWTLIGSVGTSANPQPMTWVRFQDPASGNFGAGLTDVIIICTGSGGPYIWNGPHAGSLLYTPTGWAAASGASWCALVNGIVWFGGIPATPNQIFGTGDGVIEVFETLPAFRNFVLGSPIMGLCAQGTGATASLCIGKNNGLSMLYGTGINTFYLQDVPMDDGVVAGRSMVYDSGLVYFMGQRAYWAFDGQTIPQPVSDKIEPWVLNDPFYVGGYNYPVSSSNFMWAQIYNNRLHLGYISGAGSVPNTLLLLDLVTKGWTVSQPLGGLSSMCLLDAPSDPNPYIAIVGSATQGLPYQWDFVPTLTDSAVYDDAPNNTTAVLAAAQTKYFKLGEPGTNKALMRFYPEMLVAGNFSQPFIVQTDYGAASAQTLLDQPVSAAVGAVWDVSAWDESSFAGGIGFQNFGSPASRLDFSGVQGESFAFGINMISQAGISIGISQGISQASAPWIWSGGSGVFGQRSRT